jgi:hypothetical protein
MMKLARYADRREQRMRFNGGRRIAAGLVVAALVVGVAAAWKPTVGLVRARTADVPVQVTPSFFFGARMARAEAIVVIGGVAHDFRVDRGRVIAKSAGALTLRERDGSSQTISIAPNAQITLAGRVVALRAIKRGFTATTVRDGDAAAGWVKATR